MAQPITNDTLSILPTKTLRITGEYGRPYLLELTDRLSSTQNWSTLTNFVMPGTGEFLTSDAGNAASSNRFYRLKRDRVLADSVAEFSGTQGSNNWYYGYHVSPFTAADFIPFDVYTPPSPGSVPESAGVWTPSSLNVWTRIFQIGGHPNGTTTSGGRLQVQHWAVRRWRSPVSQKVTIAVYLRDLGAANGNGIIAHVIIDGAQVGRFVLAEATEQFQSVSALVFTGSLVDFAINPRNSNDRTDTTEFRILIY
jgi:hypothetical protein